MSVPTPMISSLDIDSDSYVHSEKVKHFIQDRIQKSPEQKITFAQFMQYALYEPGLGYYVSGNKKFGIAGDFLTAPEISSLFGYSLAIQIHELFSVIEKPSIFEFGAGSGKMALDIMIKLSELNSLPTKYYILEVSPDLREQQQQLLKNKLPKHFKLFEWLDRLPAQPISGIVIANEVLDAMPCHRVFMKNFNLQEHYVKYSGKDFFWAEGSLSTSNLEKKLPSSLLTHNTPYATEINLYGSAWIKSVADKLAQGVILIIDYGYPEAEYYHPERTTGTMKCFFRHRCHEDPFILTGIQDITAHVNFTQIAEAAHEVQLDIQGYTSQGAFLINCGMENLLNTFDDEREHVNVIQQFKKLTLPTEMGELFKVMGLSRNIDLELKGFQQFNRITQL